MYAIILAGGQGTRLKPYTDDRPKSMVEVAGKPIIEHQIAKCRESGIQDIIVAEDYRKEVLQEYLGDGSSLGVKIHHLEQTVPGIGSCGAIKEALDSVPSGEQDVLILYGDILTDVNFRVLIAHHQERKMPVTIYLAKETIPLGVARLDSQGIVQEFTEKPTLTVSTGICILQRTVKDDLPAKGDFFPAIGELYTHRMLGQIIEGQWWHITNENDLHRANLEIGNTSIEGQINSGERRRL